MCEWMFLFTKGRKQKKQKAVGNDGICQVQMILSKEKKKIPALFNNALIAETAATLAK